jgi:hypothetical protein
LLKLCHHAVDNVRLWCDYVYGVNVTHRRPPVLEAVDVRNVGIEDVIFLDDIVDELLAVLVDDEYLPLLAVLASGGRAGVRDMHTSPRVVDFMVLRMTVARQLTCVGDIVLGLRTLSLDVYHARARIGHAGGVQQPVPPGEDGRR